MSISIRFGESTEGTRGHGESRQHLQSSDVCTDTADAVFAGCDQGGVENAPGYWVTAWESSSQGWEGYLWADVSGRCKSREHVPSEKCTDLCGRVWWASTPGLHTPTPMFLVPMLQSFDLSAGLRVKKRARCWISISSA